MSQNVEVDGVGVVAFPDGMSQEEISNVIARKFSQPQSWTPAAPPEPTNAAQAMQPDWRIVNDPLSGRPTVPPGTESGLGQPQVEKPDLGKGFFSSAWEGYRRDSMGKKSDALEQGLSQLPFVSSAPATFDYADLHDSAVRVRDAYDKGIEPYPEDYKKVMGFLQYQEARGQLPFASKAGFFAGSILRDLPAYIGEFMATGGAYTAGRAAAEKAIEGVAKTAIGAGARNAVKGAVAKTLGEGGLKAAGVAENLALRVPKGFAGAAAQTPFMATRVAASAAEKAVPSMQLAGEGAQLHPEIARDETPIWSNLPAGYVNTFIETFSEHSGDWLTGAGKALLSKIPGANLAAGMKQAIMNRWLRLNPNRTVGDFLNTVAKRGAYNGLWGEIAEEEAAKVGHYLTDESGQGYTPTTPEEFVGELIAFSLPGAAKQSLVFGSNRYINWQKAKDRKQRMSDADAWLLTEERKRDEQGYRPSSEDPAVAAQQIATRLEQISYLHGPIEGGVDAAGNQLAPREPTAEERQLFREQEAIQQRQTQGGQNALPIREAAPVPVAEAPRDSAQMGAQVREQAGPVSTPVQAQEPPPVTPVAPAVAPEAAKPAATVAPVPEQTPPVVAKPADAIRTHLAAAQLDKKSLLETLVSAGREWVKAGAKTPNQWMVELASLGLSEAESAKLFQGEYLTALDDAYKMVRAELPEAEAAPMARADRPITSQMVSNKAPKSEGKVETPKPEAPAAPKITFTNPGHPFLGKWSKDAEGKDVYVGPAVQDSEVLIPAAKIEPGKVAGDYVTFGRFTQYYIEGRIRDYQEALANAARLKAKDPEAARDESTRANNIRSDILRINLELRNLMQMAPELADKPLSFWDPTRPNGNLIGTEMKRLMLQIKAAKGVSAANSFRSVLSKILGQYGAEDKLLVGENVFKRVKDIESIGKGAAEGRRATASADEYQETAQALLAISPDAAFAFELNGEIPGRVGEILDLRWGDIDEQNGAVRLKTSKRGPKRKNKPKAYATPLSTRAVVLLRARKLLYQSLGIPTGADDLVVQMTQAFPSLGKVTKAKFTNPETGKPFKPNEYHEILDEQFAKAKVSPAGPEAKTRGPLKESDLTDAIAIARSRVSMARKQAGGSPIEPFHNHGWRSLVKSLIIRGGILAQNAGKILGHKVEVALDSQNYGAVFLEKKREMGDWSGNMDAGYDLAIAPGSAWTFSFPRDWKFEPGKGLVNTATGKAVTDAQIKSEVKFGVAEKAKAETVDVAAEDVAPAAEKGRVEQAIAANKPKAEEAAKPPAPEVPAAKAEPAPANLTPEQATRLEALAARVDAGEKLPAKDQREYKALVALATGKPAGEPERPEVEQLQNKVAAATGEAVGQTAEEKAASKIGGQKGLGEQELKRYKELLRMLAAGKPLDRRQMKRLNDLESRLSEAQKKNLAEAEAKRAANREKAQLARLKKKGAESAARPYDLIDRVQEIARKILLPENLKSDFKRFFEAKFRQMRGHRVVSDMLSYTEGMDIGKVMEAVRETGWPGFDKINSPDAFLDLLFEVARTRVGEGKAEQADARILADAEALTVKYSAALRGQDKRKGAYAFPLNVLNPGDYFTLAGEKFTVKSVEDGVWKFKGERSVREIEIGMDAMKDAEIYPDNGIVERPGEGRFYSPENPDRPKDNDAFSRGNYSARLEWLRAKLATEEGLTFAEHKEMESLASAMGQGTLLEVDSSKAAAARARDMRAQAERSRKIADSWYRQADEIEHREGETWASRERRREIIRERAAEMEKEAARLENRAYELERTIGKGAERPAQAELPKAKPELEQGTLFSRVGDPVLVAYKPKSFIPEHGHATLEDILNEIDANPHDFPEEVQKIFRSLAQSQVWNNFPGAKFMLMEALAPVLAGEESSERAAAAYRASEKLIFFYRWAQGKDLLHEFLHHMWRMLGIDDLLFVRELRFKALMEAQQKTTDKWEKALLQRLLNDIAVDTGVGMTSTEKFEGKLPPVALYHLINDSEFFAFMNTERFRSHLLASEEAMNFITRIKRFLAHLWAQIKQQFSFANREEELWKRLISGKYEIEHHPEMLDHGIELSRATSEYEDAIAAFDKLGTNEQEQIDRENAQLQLPSWEHFRAVRGKLKALRATIARAGTIDYEGTMYQKDRDELKGIWESLRELLRQQYAARENGTYLSNSEMEKQMPRVNSRDFTRMAEEMWPAIVGKDGPALSMVDETDELGRPTKQRVSRIEQMRQSINAENDAQRIATTLRIIDDLEEAKADVIRRWVGEIIGEPVEIGKTVITLTPGTTGINPTVEWNSGAMKARTPDEMFMADQQLPPKERKIPETVSKAYRKIRDREGVLREALNAKLAPNGRLSNGEAITLRPRQEYAVRRAIDIHENRLSDMDFAIAKATARLPLVQKVFLEVQANFAQLLWKFRNVPGVVKFLPRFMDAMKSGLERSKKAAIANEFLHRLGEFLANRDRFNQEYETRKKALEELLTFKLYPQLREAKTVTERLQIFLKALEEAEGGYTDVNGSVLSDEALENIREQKEGLIIFAESVARRNWPSSTVEKLLDEMASAAPNPSETYGTTPETFAMISEALRASPKFKNVADALITYATSVMNQPFKGGFNDQAAQDWVRTIENLVKQGTPREGATEKEIELANAARKAAEQKAKSLEEQSAGLIAAKARLIQYKLRDIRDAQVELQALIKAKDLFDTVANSPELADAKALAEDTLRYSNIMVHQNRQDLVLKAFDGIEHDVIIGIGNDGVQGIIADAAHHRLVSDWVAAAQKYMIEYRAEANRMSLNVADMPDHGPWTKAKFNGLDAALEDLSMVFNDPGLTNFENRTRVGFLQLKLEGLSFFRQFLKGAEPLLGVHGRMVLHALSNMVNSYNRANHVLHQKGPRFFKLRREALASHNARRAMKMDVVTYQIQVMNEIFREGRQFGIGDVLVPGRLLPLYGHKVTRQDIEFAKVQQELRDAFMSEVSSKSGRGIREKSGTGWITRLPASVGDLGIQMFINGDGRRFVKDIVDAYTAESVLDKFGMPLPITDTSEASQDKRIVFWNQHVRELISHILDSSRASSGFRDMQQQPHMIAAEQSLRAKLISGWDWQSNIKNIDDLINELALGENNGIGHFPKNTGLDHQTYVREELLKELAQYRDNARKFDSEKTEGPQASAMHEAGVEMSSEFTSPAQHYRLPGNLYNYGVATDYELIGMKLRAVKQPIVEFANALERAETDLTRQLKLVRPTTEDERKIAKEGGGARYVGGEREIQQLRNIVQSLLTDLKQTWNEQSLRNDTRDLVGSLTKSSLLAGAVVNIKNVVVGMVAVYRMHMALNRFSSSLALLSVTRKVMTNGMRFVADVITNLTMTSKMRSWLNENLRLIPMIGEPIADFLAQGMIAANGGTYEKYLELGFSQKRSIWEHWNQVIREQFIPQSPQQAEKLQSWMWKGLAAARAAKGVLTVAFQRIGTQYSDALMNLTNFASTVAIEKTLQEIADNYLANRSGAKLEKALAKGEITSAEYDPTKSFWALKPEDVSHRLTESGRAKNAREWEDFMRRADISMPALFWDYKKSQDVGMPQLLTEEQRQRIQSAFLRDTNAGDMANRPVAVRYNAWQRALSMFQGYSSWFVMHMLSATNGSMGQSNGMKLLTALPTLMMLAIACALFGLLSQWLTDEWKYFFRGQVAANINMMNKEFWSNPKVGAKATFLAMCSASVYLGELALWANNTVINNRGYDPTSRILIFGLANTFFQTLKGMYTMAQNDPQSVMKPVRDGLMKVTGYGMEAGANFMPGYSAKRDYTQATQIYSAAARREDLLTDKPGQSQPTQEIGPTWGMKEDQIIGFMQRNPEKFMDGFNRMVQYYANKGIENPEASAMRDFATLNPMRRGMGGKKPTEQEDAQIKAAMTEKQRAKFQSAVEGWEWASNLISANPFSYSTGKGGGGGSVSTGGSGRAGGQAGMVGGLPMGSSGGGNYVGGLPVSRGAGMAVSTGAGGGGYTGGSRIQSAIRGSRGGFARGVPVRRRIRVGKLRVPRAGRVRRATHRIASGLRRRTSRRRVRVRA